jgi:hypothetical protein
VAVARNIVGTVLLGCLLVPLALSSCQLGDAGGSAEPTRPPGTRLDLPKGAIGGIAWLPDGYLYVTWQPNATTAITDWRVAPGHRGQQVTLPGLAGCNRTEYLLPHRLPDGRLGLSRFCQADNSDQTHSDLVAYDPATGGLEMLAPLGHNAPSGVSWRRDLRSGYISHGSGICDGLAPLTRQGPGSFPNPTTIDGHAWRLDEVFRQSGTDDCRDQGRAFGPLLTPDERRLVFLASPQAQGHGGQTRLDEPRGIYVQDLPDGQPRALVRGFSDTRGMAMAPDGKHVAIAGRRGSEQGLWLVDLDSGAMRKLTDAQLHFPTFSPDGRHLAVMYRHGDYENFDTEVRVLNVPTT